MKKQHPVKQTAIDYLLEHLNTPYASENAERKQFKKTNVLDLEVYALDQLKQNRAIVLTMPQNGLLHDICLAYIFDNEVHLSTNIKLESIVKAIYEAGFDMDAIEKIIKFSCAEHQEMITSAFEQRQMDKQIAVGGFDTQSILF
jgi:hypothetical protein